VSFYTHMFTDAALNTYTNYHNPFAIQVDLHRDQNQYRICEIVALMNGVYLPLLILHGFNIPEVCEPISPQTLGRDCKSVRPETTSTLVYTKDC
jgi:hypothetical protein